MTPAEKAIQDNGYRLDRRDTFAAAASLPLVHRAEAYPGEWVLWDPNDDEDGYMIVGDDPEELGREFISHFGDWLL
ncbi:MAG: hypothetical protein AB7F22_07680 [Reyranella sp.]|uniref:hypothetical protein n=1 Tax=Reyranella sp. TaxID=1929291 RepID=UPI003D1283E2